MNLPQQTPPSLLQINTNESKSQDNKQQTNMTKSTSQPIRLMGKLKINKIDFVKLN